MHCPKVLVRILVGVNRMSNSLLRANRFQSCSAMTTLRKIRRLALTIASTALLVVPVLAQQRSSAKSQHRSNRSKQKSVNQVAPRSFSSSAVPQAGSAKSSASRQELDRIERSSVNQVKPVAHQNVHAAPASASHVSNTHERSTPMNFSYQAPHGVTKGSRTPSPARTH